ncbi:MAG: Ig-like domain-containing protein, partial [Thermoplasmata archaeon]
NYSLNLGMNTPFTEQFEISTEGWVDGGNLVQINARDILGNSNSSWFFFYIDSTPPEILLNSPQDNSIIQGGTILDFSLNEPNPQQVNYSINGGPAISFSTPFDISTADWEEGGYDIQINVQDMVGHIRSFSYKFMIDSTPPQIWVNPVLNHSIIPVGTLIELNSLDIDLEAIWYAVDEGDFSLVSHPRTIDTSTISHGTHYIIIKAQDTVGNEGSQWIKITIDALRPYVVSTIPSNQSTDIDLNTTITIYFSEPMDTTYTADFINITPDIEFSLKWELNGTKLIVLFGQNNLTQNTTYHLKIHRGIIDFNGTHMASDFELVFTTRAEPAKPSTEPQPSPTSETSFPLLILALFAIIIAVIIILAVFIVKKRREEKEEETEISEDEEEDYEEEPSKKKPSEEEERHAKIIRKLKCPKCKKIFKIVSEERPVHVTCPKCQKTFKMPEQ